MPKTAGGSFYRSLKDHFGEALLRDYDDTPINTPIFKRNISALKDYAKNFVKDYHKIECIHGHFLPLKYLSLKNVMFITWMRDPIERLASHYYWWLRYYDSKTAMPLERRVVEENWSLEKFCFSVEVRNLYSQFLWCFPFNKFSFIGISEHFETDLEYFHTHILRSNTFQVYHKKENLDKEQGRYINDRFLRKKLQQFHKKDVELYKVALKIRNQRIS